MPKASPIQTNFTAGELSPLLDGRVDLAKYANGLQECLNMVPLAHGPVTRRPGTIYAGTLKSSTGPLRPIPFEFNVEQAYVLELGDAYVRFFRNEGQIAVADTDATIANGTFATDISGWTDRSTGTGGIVWNSTGFMELDGDGSSNRGWAEQAVTIGGSFTAVEHVLRFQVIYVNGLVRPLKLRIGTTSTGTEVIDDREFPPGYHTVAFTPGATTVYVQFIVDNTTNASPDWSIGVDNVAFLDAEPLEVQAPWDIAHVFQLNHAQSADVLYICHQDYRPHALKRRGDKDWSLEEVYFERGPYQSQNTDVNVTVSANNTGLGENVTVTANAGIFESDHVGTIFKIGDVLDPDHEPWTAGRSYGSGDEVSNDGKVYEAQNSGTSRASAPIHAEGTISDGENGVDWEFLHDGSGDVIITGHTSATSVSGVVMSRIPSDVGDGEGGTTYRWAFGSYSPKYGWPGAVTFYEDRLYFGGGTTTPQRFDGSVSGDFENFKDGAKDDDAVAFTLNADEVNVIRWMNAGRSLNIGTVGGEWEARGGTSDGPITPSSINVKRATTYGSAPVQPRRIGNAVLFVQRAGRKVRELAFNLEQDSLAAPDMTLLAEHVTRPLGITQVDYQQEPHSILWCVRGDGGLLGMTYERAQDVVGWHRHVLGGAFAGGDPVVEGVAVIPAPAGDHDQVWLFVKRTVDGATVRFAEFMARPLSAEVADADAIFLDAALTYDGAPATVISGLDHLEGESVMALADGEAAGPFTVSSGQITITQAASKVHVGLAATWRLRTLRVEAGAADGTAQGKTKRLTAVTVRTDRSRGGRAGPDTATLDDLPDAGAPASGDTRLAWPAGYETEGRITIEGAGPYPFTLIATMPQLVTQDR